MTEAGETTEDKSSTTGNAGGVDNPDAPSPAASHAPRWSHRRVIVGIASAIAYPVVVIALARWWLMPAILANWGGEDVPDTVASRGAVAAFGLVMLVLGPGLIGLWLARRRPGEAPTDTVAALSHERAIGIRVAIGIALTLGIARLLWIGPGFDLDTAVRFVAFWFAWSAMAFGVAAGLARMRAPLPVIVLAPIAVAALLATSVFWLDPWLARELTAPATAGAPAGRDALDTVIGTSGMAAYLTGVFRFEIFKSGLLYTAGSGAGLSCIGEYLPQGYRYPDLGVWLAPFLSIGGAVYALGWGAHAARRYLTAKRRPARLGHSPTPSTNRKSP